MPAVFQFTPMGYGVLAVTAALLLLRPRWLLGWALFISVFQASAVVIVRLTARYPIGLQPGFFVAPVAIAAWLPSRSPRRWITMPLAKLCTPLYLLIAFAVLSATLFPLVFKGLLVDGPRGHLVALHLALTNLTDVAYLICSFLFFVVVLEETAASTDDRAGRNLVVWSLAGVGTAAAVGLYQVVAFAYGLTYPHKFFNSNPGYAQLYFNEIANRVRLSGTFTEASIASWYFGMATAYCLWQVLFARRRGWYLLALALCGVALVRTESSTAYVIVIGLALLLPFRLLWLRRVTARTVGALMAAVVLLLGALTWALRDAHFVQRLLDDLLFRKYTTLSYTARLLANRAAWNAFLATHGLGAGWGSLRASSLAATLVGTVGAIGVLLAVWFALRLVRLEWRIRSLDRMRFPHREGLIAALAVMLGAGFLSISDMVIYLPFWAFVGIYIGTAWRQDQARRARIRGQSAPPLRMDYQPVAAGRR